MRLTAPGVTPAQVNGHAVALETDLEIVAKKLNYRGDRLRARDLFDLALVWQRVPDVQAELARLAVLHRDALTRVLSGDTSRLRSAFEAIAVDTYRPSFDEAAKALRDLLSRT